MLRIKIARHSDNAEEASRRNSALEKASMAMLQLLIRLRCYTVFYDPVWLLCLVNILAWQAISYFCCNCSVYIEMYEEILRNSSNIQHISTPVIQYKQIQHKFQWTSGSMLCTQKSRNSTIIYGEHSVTSVALQQLASLIQSKVSKKR